MKKKRLLVLISREFSDTLSDKEAAELKQLLESPDTQRAYDEIQLKWKYSARYSLNFEVNQEAAWSRFKTMANDQNSKPATLTNMQMLYRVAAVLILGLMVGIYVMNTGSSFNTYVTGPGETKEFVLEDGSKIVLNELSTLVVASDFDNNERVVSLEGEGFFTVEHDREKPFVINGKESAVQVLGTSFNVEAYKDQSYVEVNVVSGKVSLHRKGNKDSGVILSEGMRGVHHLNLNHFVSETPASDNSRSWITNTLAFDDADLKMVIDDLNKYFGITIETEGAELLSCRFTSRFEEPEIEEIIAVLSATLDLQSTKTSRGYVLHGEGCSE